MARVEIDEVVVRPNAQGFLTVVAGVPVTVNVRSTGLAALVYAGESGSTQLANPLTTDALGRIEGWLEEGSYTLTGADIAISIEASSGTGGGGGGGGSGAAPGISVADYGAIGDGSTNDTAAIQAAITACGDAGGGIVYIPQGTYKLTAALTLAADDLVDIIGENKETTILSWATVDTSTTMTAIDPTIAPQKHRLLKNLTLQGPGSFAKGVTPNQMTGFHATSRMDCENVKILTFKYGYKVDGDHQSNRLLGIHGCYYGVYSPASQPTNGDQDFIDCEITSNTFAGWGAAQGGGLVNVSMHNVHMGFQPHGFFGEGSDSGTSFINSCDLDVQFERCGNTPICGPNRTINALELRDTQTLRETDTGSNYYLSGSPHDAWLECNVLIDLSIDSPYVSVVAFYTTCIIKATTSADSIRWRNATAFMRSGSGFGSSALPILIAGAIGRRCVIEWDGGDSTAQLCEATATIAQFDPICVSAAIASTLEITPAPLSLVRKIAAANEIPIGIAMTGGVNGAIVLVRTRGYYAALASADILYGAPVTAVSGATIRTSAAGEQILGMSLNSIASGQFVPIRLNGASVAGSTGGGSNIDDFGPGDIGKAPVWDGAAFVPDSARELAYVEQTSSYNTTSLVAVDSPLGTISVPPTDGPVEIEYYCPYVVHPRANGVASAYLIETTSGSVERARTSHSSAAVNAADAMLIKRRLAASASTRTFKVQISQFNSGLLADTATWIVDTGGASYLTARRL